MTYLVIYLRDYFIISAMIFLPQCCLALVTSCLTLVSSFLPCLGLALPQPKVELLRHRLSLKPTALVSTSVLTTSLVFSELSDALGIWCVTLQNYRKWPSFNEVLVKVCCHVFYCNRTRYLHSFGSGILKTCIVAGCGFVLAVRVDSDSLQAV